MSDDTTIYLRVEYGEDRPAYIEKFIKDFDEYLQVASKCDVPEADWKPLKGKSYSASSSHELISSYWASVPAASSISICDAPATPALSWFGKVTTKEAFHGLLNPNLAPIIAVAGSAGVRIPPGFCSNLDKLEIEDEKEAEEDAERYEVFPSQENSRFICITKGDGEPIYKYNPYSDRPRELIMRANGWPQEVIDIARAYIADYTPNMPVADGNDFKLLNFYEDSYSPFISNSTTQPPSRYISTPPPIEIRFGHHSTALVHITDHSFSPARCWQILNTNESLQDLLDEKFGPVRVEVGAALMKWAAEDGANRFLPARPTEKVKEPVRLSEEVVEAIDLLELYDFNSAAHFRELCRALIKQIKEEALRGEKE